VKETQQKQRLLWQDLILRYCKHHRLFVVSAEEADDFSLFHNKAINREPWGGQPGSQLPA
jgi:ESCRT-II complex subunit VPS25